MLAEIRQRIDQLGKPSQSYAGKRRFPDGKTGRRSLLPKMRIQHLIADILHAARENVLVEKVGKQPHVIFVELFVKR